MIQSTPDGAQITILGRAFYVSLEKSETGYIASCPKIGLKDVLGSGREHALTNISNAIYYQMILESKGRSPFKPSGTVSQF